jgi:Fe-S-cluster containining protein
MRLAIIGPSPCDRCHAACCRENGHAYSVLLQGEDERRRFAPWAINLPVAGDDGGTVVERVLPYRDGRCIFLGDDGLCQIYEDRPRSCRAFECTKHFSRHGPGNHSRFLQINPRVRELLESL